MSFSYSGLKILLNIISASLLFCLIYFIYFILCIHLIKKFYDYFIFLLNKYISAKKNHIDNYSIRNMFSPRKNLLNSKRFNLNN